jgi:hypothetical protein
VVGGGLRVGHPTGPCHRVRLSRRGPRPHRSRVGGPLRRAAIQTRLPTTECLTDVRCPLGPNPAWIGPPEYPEVHLRNVSAWCTTAGLASAERPVQRKRHRPGNSSAAAHEAAASRTIAPAGRSPRRRGRPEEEGSLGGQARLSQNDPRRVIGLSLRSDRGEVRTNTARPERCGRQ